MSAAAAVYVLCYGILYTTRMSPYITPLMLKLCVQLIYTYVVLGSAYTDLGCSYKSGLIVTYIYASSTICCILDNIFISGRDEMIALWARPGRGFFREGIY